MRVTKPGLSEWVYLFCNSFGFMADRLYPIEACLFRELFAVLPDSQREVFEKQLACLKVFQRWSGWRTLAMFPIRHFWQPRGVDYFPAEFRVPVEQDEVRLASFKFRVPGHEQEISVTFHLVNGRLFTLEFGTDYHPTRFARELEIVRYKVNYDIFPAI